MFLLSFQIALINQNAVFLVFFPFRMRLFKLTPQKELKKQKWWLCGCCVQYSMNIFLFVIVCFSHVMCTLHSICTVHSITYNEYDSCRSFYCKTVHFLIRQIKKKKCPFQKYCTFICYWLLWLRGSKPTWLVRVWMPCCSCCCSCCCWRSSCSWRLRTTASRTPPLAALWRVTPASTVYIHVINAHC